MLASRLRSFSAGAAIALAALTFGGIASARAEIVYRMATMGEPKSLDPHLVSGTWENHIVGDQFMGLLTDAADAKPVPGAAESWTISDDGLTYTFRLRDHKWSDGKPVAAEDFVYSFRRILDPATAAEYASILYPIKNAEAINSGKNKDLTSLGVKAVDARTPSWVRSLISPELIFSAFFTGYMIEAYSAAVAGSSRRRQL